MISETLQHQYVTLTQSAGFTSLPQRCELWLKGDDRVKFLNNFCTADLEKLENGSVTEFFILDTRGKTLSFGHVAKLEYGILISTAAGGQADELVQHLDKYIIREDVNIENCTDSTASYFVTGALAEAKLSDELSLSKNQLTECQFNAIHCRVANIELADFGFLITCNDQDSAAMENHLDSLGITQCDLDALHMKRTEYGTPWFGIEINETNLPQEMRRDEKSISFTKGCYLGQETVAMIDAFGHVNKFLVAIQLDTDNSIEPGTEIFAGESKIGAIKSVSHSPSLDSNVALGFVKCKFAESGTELSVGPTVGKVVSLPIAK